MGRSPCCSKELGLNRGAWTKQEDMILSEYIRIHGVGEWRNLPQKAGIKRRGKSCRLRWVNYLRPDIKRGSISRDEEELIIRMHRLLGNRWSLIAGRLPGRTDNEIKNYWNTHLSKKLQSMSHSDQPNSSAQNLMTRSKSPSLLQNHVFKTPPGLKITTTVKQVEMASPKGCSNSSRDEAFKFCNVKETTDDDSEHIPFAVADVSLVETEVKSSTCSMSDQQSSHSNHFAGDAATTLTENSLYLNELSSPHWNLLFSPSDCSIDFGLEEFYRGLATMATETIEFQDLYSSDQSNMQSINSFTASDCQQMEEFHDNAQHKDWIGELNYL